MNPNIDQSTYQHNLTPGAVSISPQSYQPMNNQQLQGTQPAQDSGNWFTKLLPTVGSIVGGIGGSLLDPVLGPLGTIGGSALGSAVGKAGQNAFEGKNFNLEDEGSALGEGALGGVLGGIGGKVLGGVATKGAEIAKSSLPKLLQGQVTKGSLDDATAAYLAKNGVTDMKQMANIHPHVTGDTGAFTNGVRSSLGEASNSGQSLNLSSLERQGTLPGNTLDEALTNSGISKGSSAASAVDEYIQGQLQRAVGPGGVKVIAQKGKGSATLFNNGATHTIDPNAALDMSNALYKQANKWAASSTQYSKEKADALRSVAQTIKNGLYGPETAIGKQGISDVVRKQMIDQLAPLKDINPAYYQSKLNVLQDPNLTISSIRSAQQPDVMAAKALEATANANNGVGMNVSQAVNNVLPTQNIVTGGGKGIVAGLAGKAIQSPGANAAGAGILSKMVPVLDRLSDVTTAAGKTATAPLAKGAALTAGNIVATSPNLVPNNMTNGIDMNNPQGNGTMQPPVGQSPLQLAYDIALNNSSNPYLQGSALPVLQQITGQAQQGATGQAALASLEQAFKGAGGGQGFIGGNLAKLGGMFTGNNVSAYEAQRDQAMKTLQALGLPITALPDITSTSGAANSQFQNVQSILNSINAGGQPISS